jgi:hypothetical protein
MSSLGRCSRNASAARLRGATHPAKLVVGGLVKLVDEADLDAACIFVVAPSTVIHARYLCVKLRAQLPNLKIAIGLWGATENITQAPSACAIQGRMKSSTRSPTPSCNWPSSSDPTQRS